MCDMVGGGGTTRFLGVTRVSVVRKYKAASNRQKDEKRVSGVCVASQKKRKKKKKKNNNKKRTKHKKASSESS